LKKIKKVSNALPANCQGLNSFLGLPAASSVGQAIDLAIVGIPFDGGGAPGARYAPRAIRSGCAGIRSSNTLQKENILRLCQAIDYGDLTVIPGCIEETYEEIAKGLKPLLDADIIPICMGGDHSVALGEMRALHQRYGTMALVQMDAHADVYDSYCNGKVKYNAGTFVRRALEEGLIDPARSTLAGIRTYRDVDDDARKLGFDVIPIEELTSCSAASLADRIRKRIRNTVTFLSFDIDVMDPAYAPATGSQVPGGLTSREALAILRALRDIPFKGFDLVEVNPLLENPQTTAILAATLIFEFMSLIAWQKKA